MEGKAKAEQDSLTQVEEEDTSVQAYCADSCPQRMRADKALVHWASEKIPAASVSPKCRLWPVPAPNAPETPAQTRWAPSRNRQPMACRARSGILSARKLPGGASRSP